MFKKYILLLFLILLPLLAVFLRGGEALSGITWGLSLCTSYTPSLCARNISVNVGLYDPHQQGKNLKNIAIEHFYIQWNTYKKGAILELVKYSDTRNRWPLLTVEPYSLLNTLEGKNNLFTDITTHKYDSQIQSICQDIKQYNKPLFVRWGHEMEAVTGRYPWAQTDSSGYIAAYQYFVNKCRSVTQNIYYVWSPVGNKNLAQYWPGAIYADYVGVSVYSLPQWEENNYGKVRTFAENFEEKYKYIKDFKRPIMIAELGVSGNKEQQRRWMTQAFTDLFAYPLVKSIIYFNDSDRPNAWEAQYGIPDWRIDLSLFE